MILFEIKAEFSSVVPSPHFNGTLPHEFSVALSLLSMFIRHLYDSKGLSVRKQYYPAMITSWILKREIINSMLFS